MRFLFPLLTMTLVASFASAQGNGDFKVQTPDSWTAEVGDVEPIVDVTVWFTEAGAPLTEGVFIGPLQPGVVRAIDSRFLYGSGRTITAHAFAERMGQPDTRVLAVPVSNTFSAFPLTAPILLAPSTSVP